MKAYVLHRGGLLSRLPVRCNCVVYRETLLNCLHDWGLSTVARKSSRDVVRAVLADETTCEVLFQLDFAEAMEIARATEAAGLFADTDIVRLFEACCASK